MTIDRPRLPSAGLPPHLHPQTLAIREGLPRSEWGEHGEAIYATSSFVQPDAASAARRFADEEESFTYSRFGNPSVMTMERRLAAMEGLPRCIATGSGMSANLLLLMALLSAGDHVVASRSMFGTTIRMLAQDLSRFGVQCSFVPPTDVDAWRAAMRSSTRLLLVESPSNPQTEIADIAALASLAREAGVPLAVDNSFCSPALQQPAAFGADYVVHSATKYLDGQGRVIAGALCGPDEPMQQRMQPLMKSCGFTLSPFNAWIVAKGLETLAVRMAAQSAQALALADWLERQDGVARVRHPGQPSHPQHALAMRQQNGQGGAVIALDLTPATTDGDDPARLQARAFAFLDALRVCSLTTNLGDVRTTACHPSTTSHGRLTEAQRRAAGIGQGLVRIAVGLEHLDDLMADLQRGLAALR